MEKISVSLEEQETTLNIYPTRYSKWADFYTCIPSQVNRMKKLAEQYPEDVQIESEDEIGISGKINSAWIVIRKPRTVNMTEEQKQILTERLLAMNKARKVEK